MEQFDEKNAEIAVQLFADRLKEQIDTDMINELLAQASSQDKEEITFEYPLTSGEITIAADPTSELTFTLPNWEATGAGIDSMLIATPTEPSALAIFNHDHGLVVEIKHSGEVTLGKDVAPEFAAHEFWARLAEMGGQYETRIQSLTDDNLELEGDLEDVQSQVIELQEIITEIGRALDAPEVTEYDLIDVAAKMAAELEEAKAILAQHNLLPKEPTAPESPTTAYERAMKVVR